MMPERGLEPPTNCLSSRVTSAHMGSLALDMKEHFCAYRLLRSSLSIAGFVVFDAPNLDHPYNRSLL